MRKLTGLVATIVLAIVLVACGNDGEDDEPEATAAPTDAAVTTEAEPTTPAATLESTPAPASPVSGTPVAPATPAGDATPVSTPVVPGASPVAATPVASPAAALPVAAGTDGDTQLLSGTVTLPGTANERFVIADDGCVGLGAYAGLQAGQQVVVRDEAGTIIGVAHLAATNSQVVCSWTFEVEVPASAYYAVSIPMRAEQVYTGDEVASNGGQIELTLP